MNFCHDFNKAKQSILLLALPLLTKTQLKLSFIIYEIQQYLHWLY